MRCKTHRSATVTRSACNLHRNRCCGLCGHHLIRSRRTAPFLFLVVVLLVQTPSGSVGSPPTSTPTPTPKPTCTAVPGYSDFTDLPSGPVADTFNSRDLEFNLTDFFWSDGTKALPGLAAVNGTTLAGGMPACGPKELCLYRMGVAIPFETPVPCVRAMVADHGENVNLTVNDGEMLDFDRLREVHGVTVKDVAGNDAALVCFTRVKADDSGLLRVISTRPEGISRLILAGHDVRMDDISYSECGTPCSTQTPTCTPAGTDTPTPTVTPTPFCIDFEEPALAPGNRYRVGDPLESAGYTFFASVYYRVYPPQIPSDTNYDGVLEVIPRGDNLSGGMGKEIHLNNINLSVLFYPPPSCVTLAFADLGGTVNLGVNGDYKVEGDFQQIPTIDSAQVTATGGLGGNSGVLEIRAVGGAKIQQLVIGGQELRIDHICFVCSP